MTRATIEFLGRITAGDPADPDTISVQVILRDSTGARAYVVVEGAHDTDHAAMRAEEWAEEFGDFAAEDTAAA